MALRVTNFRILHCQLIAGIAINTNLAAPTGGIIMSGVQALGVFSVAIFIFVSMRFVFKLIDLIIGLRVSREEELRGLDIASEVIKFENEYSRFAIP